MKLNAFLLISANAIVGNVAGANQLRARRRQYRTLKKSHYHNSHHAGSTGDDTSPLASTGKAPYPSLNRQVDGFSGGIYCEPTNPKFPCCNNGLSECSSEYNCCDAYRNTCVDTTRLRDYQLQNLQCKAQNGQVTQGTPAPTEVPTESPTSSPTNAPTSASITTAPVGPPVNTAYTYAPTSASPTAAPVGPPVNTAYTCSGQSNPCNANNIGQFFVHSDPTKYVHCGGAGMCWVMPCAPGTVWDSSLPPAGGCNHPN